MRGKLIIIEGIDSSGKQTQAEMLHSYLIVDRGLKSTIFDFPDYATDTGVMIEEYLRGLTNYPQKVINMIYSVNRYEKKADIEYALSNEYIVICDRYFYSNMAYGCAPDEDQTMQDIEEMDSEMPKPDLCIYIDISAEVSFIRSGKHADRNEKDLKFLRKVRQNYLDMISSYYNWNGWCAVNGGEDKQEVHEQIVARVNRLLKE